MNNEMENYIGELKELRKIASYIKDKQIFIEKHIQWLDSDIRLGAFSEWDKINKKEMKDFLEHLIKEDKPSKKRVSGVPYEVDL